MPVRKFRSVADMPGPVALPRLRGENLREATNLMRLASYLARIERVPGVRKFRSMEEAQAAKESRGVFSPVVSASPSRRPIP